MNDTTKNDDTTEDLEPLLFDVTPATMMPPVIEQQPMGLLVGPNHPVFGAEQQQQQQQEQGTTRMRGPQGYLIMPPRRRYPAGATVIRNAHLEFEAQRLSRNRPVPVPNVDVDFGDGTGEPGPDHLRLPGQHQG